MTSIQESAGHCVNSPGVASSARNTRMRTQFIPTQSFNQDGQKWCPGCLGFLPLERFSKDMSKRSGLSPRCRDCRRPHKHIQDRKRQEARSAPGAHCWYCGVALTRYNRTTDHVVATCRGGSDDAENKVACCRSCNFSKKGFSVEEFREIRRRQRDHVPYFGPAQLAYLKAHGIELPKGDPFLFWFEAA
jgi:5-methylcytosine-specific restriction endonuclease McrA